MRRGLVALASVIAGSGCSLLTDLSPLEPPTDGGTTTDTKPQRYCAKLSADWGYDYCRDFDDGESILFEWDTTKIDPGGSITLDGNSYSAPGAFLSRIEPSSAACANARVERKVEKALAQKVRVSFRLRLGGDVDYAGDYLTLRLGDGASPCDLVLSAAAGSGKITEQSGAAIEHPFALRWPTQRTWTLVELVVDRTARTLQLSVDGKAVYSDPRALGAACGASSSVVVAPGIACHETTPTAAEVRLDNLVVTH